MRSLNSETKLRIIGITGMPGSGKGEVSSIARGLGIPVRSMGDVVRGFFSDNCPNRDPMETGKFADEERKKFGKDIWALRLIQDVEGIVQGGNPTVIIDGVRSPQEVEVFRSKWGKDLSILCIHSSPETRFMRLLSRGRNDDPVMRDEFEERDRRELEWGLGDVIARADMMMINEATTEDLRKNVLELMSEVKV
jgi:dephospho-CoA kinase